MLILTPSVCSTVSIPAREPEDGVRFARMIFRGAGLLPSDGGGESPRLLFTLEGGGEMVQELSTGV